jgi:putative DNA primase/helicase
MNANKLESDPVRAAARGRWAAVLQALAPELGAALAKPGRHVGCPVLRRSDGFRKF